MTLQFAKKNAAFNEVADKLIELSLAIKKKKLAGMKKLVLVDGKENINGKKALFLSRSLEHLDQVQGELNSWYYCDC